MSSSSSRALLDARHPSSEDLEAVEMAAGAPAAAAPAPQDSRSLLYLRSPPPARTSKYAPLSEEHGFLGRRPPPRLPPSHRAWEDMADQLPQIYAGHCDYVKKVREMPNLPAGPDALPDEHLQRAATVLGIISLTTYHLDVRSRKTLPLPESIDGAWKTVCARLGRPHGKPVVSFQDMFLSNWKFKDDTTGTAVLKPFDTRPFDAKRSAQHAAEIGEDAVASTAATAPAAPGLAEVDNVHRDVVVSVPAFGFQAEAVFYKSMVDIHFQTRGLPALVARAQSAVLSRDDEWLAACLGGLISAVKHMTDAFLRISPHPFSETYVDPAEWGRTVGLIGTPVHDGSVGPSGLTAPAIVLLDNFLDRKKWDSRFGRESKEFFEDKELPEPWHEFIMTVIDGNRTEGANVRTYIENLVESARETDAGAANAVAVQLQGLWDRLIDSYAGEHGFLDEHRIKVYGFIEVAMKAGRSETVGMKELHAREKESAAMKAKQLWKGRKWNEIAELLDDSRQERGDACRIGQCPFMSVKVKSKEDTDSGDAHLQFDLSGVPMLYDPGDCVEVMPRNSPELVENMLKALAMHEDVSIDVHDEWREHLRKFNVQVDNSTIPARRFLELATLRPLRKNIALQMLEVVGIVANVGDTIPSPELATEIDTKLDTYEAWDFLELLRLVPGLGADFTRLRSRMSDIFAPLLPRQYSIASCPQSPHNPGVLDIMVGKTTYVDNTHDGDAHGGGSGAGRAGAAKARKRRMSSMVQLDEYRKQRQPVAADGVAREHRVGTDGREDLMTRNIVAAQDAFLQRVRQRSIAERRGSANEAGRPTRHASTGTSTAARGRHASQPSAGESAEAEDPIVTRQRPAKTMSYALQGNLNFSSTPVQPALVSAGNLLTRVKQQLQDEAREAQPRQSSLFCMCKGIRPRRNDASEQRRSFNNINRQGVCSTMLRNLQVHDSANMSILRSNRTFKLPSDPSIPIVLFALGSGIAPFLGFIHARREQEKEHRARGGSVGETWLFWGAKNQASAATRDLEKLCEDGWLRLVVCYSREDCHSELIPRTASGAAGAAPAAVQGFDFKVLSGGGKKSLTAAILKGKMHGGADATSYVIELRRLCQNRCVFFMCGHPDMLNHLRRVLEEVHHVERGAAGPVAEAPRAPPQNHVYALAAQNRLMYDLFYSGKVEDRDHRYTPAQVAKHHTHDDCWVTFKQKVFNITDFLFLHPGGHKLLLMYGGRDMTQAFEEAHGKDNLRVEMLCAPFYEGEAEPDARFDLKEQESQHEAWQNAMETALDCRSIINCSLTGPVSDIAEAHVVRDTRAGIGLSKELYEHLADEQTAVRIFEQVPGARDTTVHEFAVTTMLSMLKDAADEIDTAYDPSSAASKRSSLMGKFKAAGSVTGKQAETIHAIENLVANQEPERIGVEVERLLRHDTKYIKSWLQLAIDGADLARPVAGATLVSDSNVLKARQKAKELRTCLDRYWRELAKMYEDAVFHALDQPDD